MEDEKTEGLVLRSQDYKERHRIITVFTPQGIASMIVRGISRKNTRLLTLTTPFCHGEFLYRRGRSELLSFRDGSVIDDYLSLRQSLTSLQAAGALATAILTSQMPGKASPALFVLYKSYHKQVSQFSNPDPLIASFYLKLLKHEGLLTVSDRCSIGDCGSPLVLHEGESFCTLHSPSSQGGFCFLPQEWDLLLALDLAQQFSALKELSIPPFLLQKITALFHNRLSH